jgi:hypothetical protein
MRRVDLATLLHDEPALTARHTLQIRWYSRDGEQVQVTTFYLESSRVYFDGRRLWFRCPRCEGRCLRDLADCVPALPPIAVCLPEGDQRRLGNPRDAQDRSALEPGRSRPLQRPPRKAEGHALANLRPLVERYEVYNDQWGLEIMRRFGRHLR